MKNHSMIVTIIPARNEEKSILKTLKALDDQTIHPRFVVVVDDGSSDNTLQVLSQYNPNNFKLIVKSRPNRKGGKSLVGTPSIAKTFNIGFKVADQLDYDFIMVLGADTILEKKYNEKLIKEFEKDQSLAIGSGQSKQMAINPTHARGSGRLIDVRFWKFYGKEYPTIYGWEDDCIVQCQRLGLKVMSYKNIRFTSIRKDQGTIDFINWGRAARAMGYHPIIAILRGFRFLLLQKYGIKATIRFLAGYLSEPIDEYLKPNQKKNREFLRRNQIRNIPKKAISIIGEII